MKFGILKKEDLNVSVQEQISELFKQLSAEKKQTSLCTILNSNNSVTVAYCTEGNQIIGIALMAEYKVISGYKGWIEDVIVNKNYRGQGIGRNLVELLIKEGKIKNFNEFLLFTEDEKKPAINLYKSLGFDMDESKIYILKNKT
jgi:phosphinothricin acetyltransferase